MEAFNALFASPSWINTTPEPQQNVASDTPQPAPASVQSANVGNNIVDEWSKQTAGIDLHDQAFGIADIQAAASSTSSPMGPLQHYLSQFSQPMQPASGTIPYYAAYNGMGFGQTQWPQSVPLSTYSTLNGATSSLGQNQSTSQQQPQAAQQSQQQSQQQGQASPPHPVIDPSLTINGTSSSPSQAYSPPHVTGQQNPQRSPTTTFINHFQPSHPHQSHQSPPLAINPILFSAQNMQQQRTLSPQQLHAQQSLMTMLSPIFYQPPAQAPQQQQRPSVQSQSPPLPQPQTAPVQTNLTASSSTSASSTPTPISEPSEPSPEERKKTLQDKLKILLSPSSLGNASTVRGIVRAVEDFGVPEVEPPRRVEIMSKIRDNAGNQFFRAWSESVDAMDLLRDWLKAGATAKEDGQLEETIMPLLHVIDRLPLTIEQLKQVKIGKIIVKLTKDPPNAAIKDMASNIERKWRQMMTTSESKKSEVIIEDKTKKRKLAEGTASSSKTAPPTKRIAVVATTASKTAVKKETKVVVTAVNAKADSSFFSAPKPKPKLPSFKKAAVPSTASGAGGDAGGMQGPAAPGANGTKEEHLDPFQEALKAMAKNRTASPAVSTPEPLGTSTPAVAGSSTKSVKKRKSVTWPADDQLEKVRIIEKAVYDDDPADGVHHVHSVRDLDRGEGAALHAQNLFEELVDWYEPIPIEIPEDILSGLRPGADSEEKNTQEEREKGALASFYINEAQIPDSPAEPASQIPADQVDVNVKIMLAGVDIQPFFQQAMSVSDLVGQLRAPEATAAGMSYGQGDVAMSNPTANGNVNPALNVDLRTLGLDPSTLTMLAQQLGQLGPAAAPNVFTGYDAGDPNAYVTQPQPQPQQNWGGYSGADGYGDYDERDRSRDRDGPRGRGWRGRGRGGMRGGRGGGDRDYKSRRQQPCTFYAQGRCKFGDACDFSHDQLPQY